MSENKRYMITMAIGVGVFLVLCIMVSLFANLVRAERRYTDQPNVSVGPTRTPDLLGIKEPGFYLVNSEIAPGIWRTTGDSNKCYWALRDKKHDYIENYFGMAGGTIFVSPTAFELEVKPDCGNLIYLGK